MKKIFLISAITSLLALTSVFSIFKSKTNAVEAKEETVVPVDEAAFHIELSAKWNITPFNEHLMKAEIKNNKESDEYYFKTEGIEVNNKRTVIASFNSLAIPEYISVDVINNGFTAKEISWWFTIYYQGKKINEINDSHFFYATFDKDYSYEVDVLEKCGFDMKAVFLTSSDAQNDERCCHNLYLPSIITRMPYIANMPYAYPTNEGIKEVIYEIPFLTDGIGFAGYYFEDTRILDSLCYPCKDDIDLTANITVLTSEWKYNLTLIDYGATKIDPLDYYVIGKINYLPTPEKDGFEFLGWFNNPDFIGEPITFIPSDSIGDITLYAKWQAAMYSIEYMNMDDAYFVDEPHYVYEHGETYLLPTPCRDYYSFLGWYDNSKFEGQTITKISHEEFGDKTFYAKWQGFTYYVFLITNGADKCEPLETYVHGIGAILPIPHKNNHTFVGWYDNPDFLGEPIYNVMPEETGDKFYYAKWEAYNYNVTLKTNGADYCEELTGYTYGIGAILPVPMKIGYTFKGWYKNILLIGETVTEITSTDKGDKTFYAKWEVATYKVTLNTNGADYCDELTSYKYGKDVTLPIPTKLYADFDGWYDNEGCIGDPITMINSYDYGDKVFYAKWIGNIFSVTLNDNNADYCDPLTEYSYGVGAKLPTPYRTGYTFAGWYDNFLFLGEPISEITKDEYGDKEYFAMWEYASYKVTLITYGGMCEPLDSYTYGDTTILPIPHRDGDSFDGWYNNSLFSGEAITQINDNEFGDKTFYAKYVANVYPVQLHTNNADYCPDFDHYTHGVVTQLPVPTKIGYNFDGWYDNPSFMGTSYQSISEFKFGLLEFWAKWSPAKFSITLFTNGATSCEPVYEYTYGTSTLLPVPTKSGFIFKGWYDNAQFEGKAYTSISANETGNKAFYAKWEANPNSKKGCSGEIISTSVILSMLSLGGIALIISKKKHK